MEAKKVGGKNKAEKTVGGGAKQVACRYWLNGEKCRFGDQCSYYHPAGKFGKGGETGGKSESNDSDDGSSESSSSSTSGKNKGFRQRPAFFKTRGGFRGGAGGGRGAGWRKSEYSNRGNNEDGFHRNSQAARNNDEQDEAKSIVLCRYWKRGIVCRFGRDCRFRHVIHPHDDSEEAAFHQNRGGGSSRGRKPFSAKPFSSQRGGGGGGGYNKKDLKKTKPIAKKNSINQQQQQQQLKKQEEEEEEANSGGGILGFNANQVMELLEKNVKPWDEGARAVLEQKKETSQQITKQEETTVLAA